MNHAGSPGSETSTTSQPRRSRLGFTLLELLVVLGIIGVLAGLSLPALRGLAKAGSMDSAVQQLVDDLALARARALNNRTIIHLVFVPGNVGSMNFGSGRPREVGTRLEDAPYRTYGLFAERSVGDQPGRPYFRYLDEWRTLPDGIIFAMDQFPGTPPGTNQVFELIDIPFPTAEAPTNTVPHLAFGPEGGLVDVDGVRLINDQFIALNQGSILAVRNDQGDLVDYDVRPVPNGETMLVRIDGFTGRARVEKPQFR